MRVAAVDPERHLHERAGRPDGVHVGGENERRPTVAEPGDEMLPAKFDLPSERFELGGDEEADVREALGVGRGALELDKPLQQLEGGHAGECIRVTFP